MNIKTEKNSSPFEDLSPVTSTDYRRPIITCIKPEDELRHLSTANSSTWTQDPYPLVAKELVLNISVKNEFTALKTEPLPLNCGQYVPGTTKTSSENFQSAVNSVSEENTPRTSMDLEKNRVLQSDSGENRGKSVVGLKQKSLKNPCSVCNKVFSSRNRLKAHMATHETNYTCVVCDRIFKHQFVYAGHMREHAGEGTPYWCDLCGKKFPSVKTLQSHRRLHTLEARWDCSVCGSVFSRKDKFENHMKEHANPENSCGVCSKQFSSSSCLRIHRAVHEKEKPYSCPVCEKGFNVRSRYRYHMKFHTGEKLNKPHVCDVCGLSFADKLGHKNHMNIHTGVRPYSCEVCHKTFSQISTKQSHVMTHIIPSSRRSNTESAEQLAKNIAESHACEHCLLNFTHKRYLDSHLRKAHRLSSVSTDDLGLLPCWLCETRHENHVSLSSHLVQMHCHKDESTSVYMKGDKGGQDIKEIVLKCNICAKHLSMETVRDHMKNHGDKRFVCRVCGVKFHQVGNVKRHMRCHTGETPYGCKHCGETFRILKSLNKHKAEHGGKSPLEKRYKCETCGKMFLDNYHLNRHSWTHMKKYKCEVCRTSFVDVDMFEKHKLSHVQ